MEADRIRDSGKKDSLAGGFDVLKNLFKTKAKSREISTTRTTDLSIHEHTSASMSDSQRWQAIREIRSVKRYDELPQYTQSFRSLVEKSFDTDAGYSIEMRLTPNRSLDPQVIMDKETRKQERQYWKDQGMDKQVLDKVKLVGKPESKYNCHGFTFAGGAGWVSRPADVQKILADNAFRETRTPQIGDVIIYRGPDRGITHSGIVTKIEQSSDGAPRVAEVMSKWNDRGLYSHAPDHVPSDYGTWQIYHSDRPDGSLLKLTSSEQLTHTF